MTNSSSRSPWISAAREMTMGKWMAVLRSLQNGGFVANTIFSRDYELSKVKDKVVQDVDETKGTGTWTCQEAVRLNVPTPTITSTHFSCLASAE